MSRLLSLVCILLTIVTFFTIEVPPPWLWRVALVCLGLSFVQDILVTCDQAFRNPDDRLR